MQDLYRKCLEISRKTIVEYRDNNNVPDLSYYESDEDLMEKKGLYITFFDRETGNILARRGHMTSDRELLYNIRDMTVAAYNKIREYEDRLQIGITFISDLKAHKKKDRLDLNGKGLYIQYFEKSATLLPDEIGEDENPEDVVARLCRKKGFSPQLYREGNLLLFTYNTETVRES
ncbi:MAG: AMMECR1 domain-containing protein [Candidatus Muiribacteriaceae bacterium]